MTTIPWRAPAAGAAVTACALLLPQLTGLLPQLTDLVPVLAALHATVLVLHAGRRAPVAQRRVWSALTVALAGLTLRLGALAVPGQGADQLADVLLLPVLLGATGCLMAFGRLDRANRRAPGRLGSIASVTAYVCASVFTLCYSVVIEPMGAHAGTTSVELVVALGCCLGAAAGIGHLAVVAASVPARLRASAGWLLGAQTLAAVAACTAVVTGAGPSALRTAAGLALIGAGYAAATAAAAGRRTITDPDASPFGDDTAALWVIRLALLAPPAALALTVARGHAVSVTLTVLCCVLFILVAGGTTGFLNRIGRLTARLRRTQDHFRGLVEHSSDVITVLDDDLRVVFASPAASQVLGLDPAQLTGARLPELVAEPDRDELTRLLTCADGESTHVQLVRPGQEDRELEVLAEGRRDTGLIVRLRDVTDRRAHERTLERMAFTDHLTGLPNRAAFTRAATDWTARHQLDGRAGVLLLDLDGFKAVNDTAGHEAGDTVLVEVGRRLHRVVRDDDVVARLGGDEYALLVAGTPAEVDDVARRLLAAIARPVNTPAGVYAVGASVGVTTIGPAGGQTALREADIALRSAKEIGKGCVRRWSPAVAADSHRAATLSADLGPALRAGRLQVRYQPVLTPGNGRVVLLELQCAWSHPEFGEVEQAELAALADGQGLALDLARWLLGQALAESGELIAATGVALAAQVAPDRNDPLRRSDIVLTALADHGVRPDQLVLLIDEVTLLTSSSDLIASLRAQQASGVRLCLADYGLGRTMIAHRTVLSPDLMRIDLRGLGSTDHRDVIAAARASLAVADSYGMATLVQGVATSEHYALACDLDVAGVSGPAVAGPVGAAELPGLWGRPEQVATGVPRAVVRS